MANEVSFKIKIDGNTHSATVEATEFGKALEKVQQGVDKLNKDRLNFAAMLTACEAVTSALGRISGAIGELTDYYKQQEVAEAKLAQVMQNTMGATEADTQAILDLCSAQQKLGVIGDEVQIAGAQELATYLTQRDTLESLIPVMNDMVAQQYGLGATQENAAQIATMLGKVMDGQVNALSRYGYKFDEAQETILKFGTEEERAAVLAEVVGASVGGVNQALAQTSSGKMQQLANAVGDVKEQLGKVLVNVQPVVNGLIGMGQTVISIKEIVPVIMNIGSALGGLIGKLATADAAWIRNTATMLANKAALIAHTVAQGAVKAATVAWTAVQKVLNLVLIANPIGLIVTAIGALVAGIVAAYQKCDKFREVCDILWAAIKKVAQIVWDSLVAAFKATVQVVKDVYTWYKNLQQTIHDKVVGAFNACKDAVVGFWNKADGLRSALAKVWEVIKNVTPIGLLIKAFDKVAEAVKKAWNWIKRFVGVGEDTADDAAALNDEADAANNAADAYENLAEAKGSIKLEGGAAATTDTGKPGKPAAPKGSIAAIDARMQTLRTELSLAIDSNSRAKVQAELDNLEAEKRIIEFETRLKMDGIDSIRELLDEPKLEPIDITVNGLPNLQITNAELKKVEKTVPNTTKDFGKLRRTMSGTNDTISASGELMGAVGDIFKASNGGVEDATSAWLNYGAAVAQSCAQMVAAILSLIPAKEADAQQSKKNTTANVAEASSGFFAAHAEIPFVGIVLALAAVAGMVATIMSLPKFAKGGIAYGPTMGLFGEYPGAANNPEVVAPLDRLRGLLATDNGSGGQVRFEIEGRKLVGVLAKENNVMARR